MVRLNGILRRHVVRLPVNIIWDRICCSFFISIEFCEEVLLKFRFRRTLFVSILCTSCIVPLFCGKHSRQILFDFLIASSIYFGRYIFSVSNSFQSFSIYVDIALRLKLDLCLVVSDVSFFAY
jgi:hypothetical protein